MGGKMYWAQNWNTSFNQNALLLSHNRLILYEFYILSYLNKSLKFEKYSHGYLTIWYKYSCGSHHLSVVNVEFRAFIVCKLTPSL